MAGAVIALGKFMFVHIELRESNYVDQCCKIENPLSDSAIKVRLNQQTIRLYNANLKLFQTKKTNECIN